MRRMMGIAAIVIAALCAGGGAAEAQTRADTAAVLLNAADQLRLRGEAGAARAVLDLIARQYAGTPAAGEVDRLRLALRRTPEPDRPGRTELLVSGATYGAWLGLAVPLALEANEAEAYGLGLLAGAPIGFLAARAWAGQHHPTTGQVRAITFGGLWGTYQGFMLGEVLDVGQDRVPRPIYCEPTHPCQGEYYETETDATARIGLAIAGGLAGIAGGAYLARKPITAGTAAAATLGGFWGTWFGFALATVAGQEDDEMLATTLIVGNVGLAATGVMAPSWQMSESRARLISVGGLIGGLGGLGLVLIMGTEDEEVAVGVPMLASAGGLAYAAYATRQHDAMPADGEQGRGALLNLREGRWSVDVPAAGLRLERAVAGPQARAYVPLLQARF